MNYFLIINLIMSIVFYISSISKILYFNNFLYSIIDFNLLFKKLNYKVVLSGLVILATEFILAICFSLNIFIDKASILACILLLVFNVLFIRAYYQRNQVSCNCFGKSDKNTNIPFAIFRNSLLIVLVIIVYLRSESILLINDKSITFFCFSLIISLTFILYKETKILVKLNRGKNIDRV